MGPVPDAHETERGIIECSATELAEVAQYLIYFVLVDNSFEVPDYKARKNPVNLRILVGENCIDIQLQWLGGLFHIVNLCGCKDTHEDVQFCIVCDELFLMMTAGYNA